MVQGYDIAEREYESRSEHFDKSDDEMMYCFECEEWHLSDVFTHLDSICDACYDAMIDALLNEEE